MGEITLTSGKVIIIDVSEMTVDEWRKFAGPGGTSKDEDAVVAKCTGLKADDIKHMNYQEFRRIVHAIIKACREPIADPN